MASETSCAYSVERIDSTNRCAVVRAYEDAWAGDLAPSFDVGQRYDWLYAGNPAGHAQVLRLCTPSGRAVGAVAVVPRRFWIGNTRLTLGLLCDFVVHRSHRTLMPALLLQRAARDIAGKVGSGTYAIPNSKSLPVIRRLGDNVVRLRPRLARVLRSYDYLARRSATFARAASGPMDTVAAAWDFIIARLCPWLRAEWLTTFDDAFDDLWRRRSPNACFGDRSSEFLRWRFGMEPCRRNATIGVFDQRTDQLVAYSVGLHVGSAFEMRDVFFCHQDPIGLTACIALMTQKIRSTEAHSISCRLYSEDRIAQCFSRMGFRERETETVFLHSAIPACPVPSLITRADEDV